MLNEKDQLNIPDEPNNICDKQFILGRDFNLY